MNTREQVAKNWEKRGFSCGLWEDPPGQVWEDYVHEADELFLAIEGDVELEVNGQKFQPAPWEEILIPAKVYHSVRNIGTSTSRWLYGYKH